MKADKGRKFAKGGLFGGKETPAEEMKEAKALKAGKISPKQYVAVEKSEGHGAGAAKKATAIKSGKLSPAAYAKEHAMKKGGCVKKMADGGDVEGFDWASLKVKPREETITERMPARKMDQGERPRMVRKTGPNWTDMRLSGGKSALEDRQKGMGNMGEEPERIGWKKGGSVSSASKRADGCATKGKTKGTMVKMCGGGYAKKGK